MVSLALLDTPLVIGSVELPNRLFLAPMSGITDEAFRLRAGAHGAGLVVSEMVASGELAKGRDKSAIRIRRPGSGGVHAVQLAGREAAAMAEAARIAEGEGADIIDINMGCPARKVTGGYCGSALMRDPDHALRLIEATAGAVSVPVTVKMRLGWDETALNAPLIARSAEAAGVAMVTVHGRTRCQLYKGRADWRAIAQVRQAVAIPLVANGDIDTPDDAIAALEQSGADALMVGRAHYGAPWAAGALAAFCGGRRAADVPETASALAGYVIAHYEAMLSLYGVESGLRQARKHLGWYLARHAPAAPAALVNMVKTSPDPATVIAAIRTAFDAGWRAGPAEEAA